MNTQISYCGLICDGCPIFLATREKDSKTRESMRKSIANLCYENYGLRLQASDISDCDGCKAGTGRLFAGCGNCEIRDCAIGKGYVTCGLCPEFACDKLDRIFHEDPNAKIILKKIRQVHQV